MQSKQCLFLSIFTFAAIVYTALINLDFTTNGCNYKPTLEYCVKIHNKKIKEKFSGLLERSTAGIDTNLTLISKETTQMSSSTTSTSTKTFSTESVQISLSPTNSGEITTGPNTPSTLSKATMSSNASTLSAPPFNIRENNPWWTCPESGKGRQSVILSALVDGRLGNVVWSYLSVLVTARIYGLRPVLHNATIGFLVKHAFDVDHIRMPTLDWMDKECNMSGWLETALRNVTMCKTINSRRNLHDALEKPPKVGLEMYRYVYYVTTTEFLVPNFYELKKELVLQKDKVQLAQKNLHEVKKSFSGYLKHRGFSRTDFEFVGVHVRRTDFLHHMDAIHHFGKVATPKFFHTAMDWLVKELSTPLVFVVVSDDRNWTKANIVADRQDVYLTGDGDISNPGVDLAILAACNHTIFAYGTFGLTGAFLASRPGGYTIIFDPENGTITKEMEFASNLPGWRIMTEDGKITYRENVISYIFYGHPRAELDKNA